MEILLNLVKSGRSVNTMNAKNRKKSPIHENADANITCDFGDSDISRFRSRLPHTRTHGHTDTRTHGHTDTRTHGHTDTRPYDHNATSLARL